jgi:hypothetical protein
MKIRMLLKPGIWLLLIAGASIPVIKQRIDDENNIKAAILVFCALFVVYMVTLLYQVIIFDKDNLIVINGNATNGVPCKNKVIIPYSEFSCIYFATVKENRQLSKWIILCPRGQEQRRINTKDLMHAIISKDSFVAFKYSKKRQKIVLNTFSGHTNIIVEYMDVDNATGQRTVHSSSKFS